MPHSSWLKAHLSKHWHYHLSLWSLFAVVLSFVLGAGASYAFVARGGYHRGPLPRKVHISRNIGGALPTCWRLGRYLVRIHNQGNSSSCVGQTLSTITELTTREHTAQAPRGYPPAGKRIAFSAGYIYDQINGGQDGGSSYQDAFEILRTQGDAPLATFPHDGQDWWIQPSPAARAAASSHHVSQWRSILPTDRYTMSFEIRHGRPIAIAIPVTDSFYDQWQESSLQTVWAQLGAFHFWHSVTGIRYDQYGVTVINSWGPQYGYHGRIRLSWGFLRDVGASVVVSSPYFPPKRAAQNHRRGAPHGRPHSTPRGARTNGRHHH